MMRICAHAVCIVIIVLLLPFQTVWAEAGEADFDPGRPCSLKIIYLDGSDSRDGNDGSLAVAGSEFACLRVASIASEKGRPGTVYEPCVRRRDGTWLDVDPDTDAEAIRAEVEEAYQEDRTVDGASCTGVTSRSGELVFREMRQGLYLVAERKPAAFHLPSSPFLISLPQSDGEGWSYSAEVFPKPVPEGTRRIVKKTPAPTPSSSSEENNSTSGQPVSPVKTGDDSPLLMWIFLMAAGAYAAFLILKKNGVTVFRKGEK